MLVDLTLQVAPTIQGPPSSDNEIHKNSYLTNNI